VGQFILFDQITVSRFVPIGIIRDLTLLSPPSGNRDIQCFLYAGLDRHLIDSAPWLES